VIALIYFVDDGWLDSSGCRLPSLWVVSIGVMVVYVCQIRQ
jgi:hypothetical protein